jgi:signal transduction histidine kinase
MPFSRRMQTRLAGVVLIAVLPAAAFAIFDAADGHAGGRETALREAAIYLSMMVAGALAAMMLARKWITAPIVMLRRATDALAAGERPVIAAIPSESAELEELRVAIERVALHLAAKQRAVRQATAAQNRFVAVARHDMRQPLQALAFRLELASHTAPPATATHLKAALSAIAGLRAQLARVAELMRRDIPDQGDLQPILGPVSLSSIFTVLREEFAPLAELRGIELRTVPSRLVVSTDQAFLFTILLNLMSNAVQYTGRGRVLLGCRRAGAACRIEVLDTGSGMTAERLRSISSLLASGNAPARESLGLGLMIVREMAMALGHRVQVRGLRHGGSCFAVEVPIARAASE